MKDLDLEEREMLETLAFHSRNNEFTVRYSDNCGCYSCITKFKAKTVTKWSEDGETALCPNCGKPSVVPDAIGTVTVDILRKIKKR